jgi:hypothetical protein
MFIQTSSAVTRLSAGFVEVLESTTCLHTRSPGAEQRNFMNSARRGELFSSSPVSMAEHHNLFREGNIKKTIDGSSLQCTSNFKLGASSEGFTKNGWQTFPSPHLSPCMLLYQFERKAGRRQSKNVRTIFINFDENFVSMIDGATRAKSRKLRSLINPSLCSFWFHRSRVSSD